MDYVEITPIVLARATEQLRQERETFNQVKKHEERWFVLRLVMGYSAVILLTAVMIIASYILFSATAFPVPVVTAAGAALFADVVGLLVAVWKIALNPDFSARLGPVTKINLPETNFDDVTS
jgi:membrane-associated HD superfamily phosphohydrolase